MQGGSAVSIRIKNPVLADIVKKYPSLGFEVKGALLSFLDERGEESVPYESVPSSIQQIPSCILDGFQACCDDEGATDFEEEYAAHKKEILKAYETVYWDYSEEYSLDEPLEDHVGQSDMNRFRQCFADDHHISVNEVDEEEFQSYLDSVSRICRDESFHYKNGKENHTGEYTCEYTIVC